MSLPAARLFIARKRLGVCGVPGEVAEVPGCRIIFGEGEITFTTCERARYCLGGVIKLMIAEVSVAEEAAEALGTVATFLLDGESVAEEAAEALGIFV